MARVTKDSSSGCRERAKIESIKAKIPRSASSHQLLMRVRIMAFTPSGQGSIGSARQAGSPAYSMFSRNCRSACDLDHNSKEQRIQEQRVSPALLDSDEV